jgi:hypothetical protein
LGTRTHNLPIPRLVNGCQVLCGLLDQGEHNEAEELIRDACFDYVLDAHDEEHGEHGYNYKGQHNGDDALGKGEFRLGDIFVVVQIGVLVGFEDFVENGVL